MHCKLLEFTMANMRRRASSLHVLFACLLLAASLLNNHFAVEAHQVAHARSVQLKLRSMEGNPMPLRSVHVMPSWREEMPNRKNPSGPNPIGNRHPASSRPRPRPRP
ncbi:hypothetical protein PIB30_024876 [Stylosanthes scabra]|uniref:CLAVATA3/ESR (CLE)-related protein 46 n=1 Tax=Stylosanthes scabra TaxID=79078 RepID=A0ABU6RA38_9FABA|nr:hypothetical protein [Stylosanthes scabra]